MTGITNAAGYQAKFDRVLELRERGPFPDLGSPWFLAVAFCLRIRWNLALAQKEIDVLMKKEEDSANHVSGYPPVILLLALIVRQECFGNFLLSNDAAIFQQTQYHRRLIHV